MLNIKEQKEIYELYQKERSSYKTDTEFRERCGISRQQLDRIKSKFSSLSRFLTKQGIDPSNAKYGWVKGRDYSMMIKFPNGKEKKIEDIIDKQVEKIKKSAPKFKKIKYGKVKDSHALIINFSDLHIGENTEDAISRAEKSLSDVLSKVKSWNIDKIIYIGGNDLLHVDNAHYTTTKGTQLETDRTWHDMFDTAHAFYINVLSKLMQIATIEYIHIPSNHDRVLGYALSKTVEAYFSNSKDIHFTISNHPRVYTTYGENMLSFTHGAGITVNNLPMVLAHEASDKWAKKYKYCYAGHIHHHKKIKYVDAQDYPGLNIEYLRSPSQPNQWATDSGYVSQSGIQTFLHSKDGGKVARIDTNF